MLQQCYISGQAIEELSWPVLLMICSAAAHTRLFQEPAERGT